MEYVFLNNGPPPQIKQARFSTMMEGEGQGGLNGVVEDEEV